MDAAQNAKNDVISSKSMNGWIWSPKHEDHRGIYNLSIFYTLLDVDEDLIEEPKLEL